MTSQSKDTERALNAPRFICGTCGGQGALSAVQVLEPVAEDSTDETRATIDYRLACVTCDEDGPPAAVNMAALMTLAGAVDRQSLEGYIGRQTDREVFIRQNGVTPLDAGFGQIESFFDVRTEIGQEVRIFFPTTLADVCELTEEYAERPAANEVMDDQLDNSDRVRIVSRTGGALLIDKTRWSGDVGGSCVAEDRFTITLITPERVVHYLNRRLTPADLLALRDFVYAALVQDELHLIPAASCQAAGFVLSVRALEGDRLDLSAEIVAYLDEEVPDVDGVVFLIERAALWESRDMLDRWLELGTAMPDDLSELGDV